MRWLALTLLVVTAAMARDFNRVLARFDGVEAYSNEELTGKKGKLSEIGPRQCVDLVQRYLQKRGIEWVPITEAKNFFPMCQSGQRPQLQAFPNGSRIHPERGDILGFDNGESGHLAIIAEVEVDQVWLVEQNWARDSAIHVVNLRPDRGSWFIANRSGRTTVYRPQGWCRIVATQPVRPNPVTICIVADRSESMRGEKIRHIHEAIVSLFRSAQRDDQVALVGFSNIGRIFLPLLPAREGRGLIEDVLAEVTPAGTTDLEAGLIMAEQVLRREQDAYIVLLSDGRNRQGDYRSRLERFRQKGWPIAVVPYGNDGDESVLREVAQVTGGVLYPRDLTDLKPVYQRITGLHTKAQSKSSRRN